MSLAFYREYRPKSFDEVLGQEHIVTVLKNEIQSKNPSHAYLFVGSRGTGKTTCAKLLAKAVNCLNPVDGNPCGVCESCLAADDGTNLDITEIDAASNNGVDSIRDLRDEVLFSPNKSKYRVYIIDEVHMLSQSAFNALLKTLEEPPEYVIFILATTEIHKVLPTIISRCQRFDFKKVNEKAICERLFYVANEENIKLDNDAAALIARLSDGGMRDALSLLDVCAAHDNHITENVVSNVSGITGSQHLINLSNTIINKDVSQMFSVLGEIFSKGLSPLRTCRDLIMHFRNLLVVKTVKEPWEMINCLKFETELMSQQSKLISNDDILYGIDVLQNCLTDMSKGIDNRIALETSLLILSDKDRRNETKTLLQRIERLEKIISLGKLTDIDPNKKENSKKHIEHIQDEELSNQSDSVNSEYKESKASNSKKNDCVPFDMWQGVLSEIETENPSIFGMLNGTTAYYDGKHVLIDVNNPLLLQMLKDNNYTKNCIKQAIFVVTGISYPIGPYKPQKEKEKKNDPLEGLIKKIENQENVIIR